MLFLGRVDLHLLHVAAAVVHHAHGELLDARRKGGAEHHGLLACTGQVVDLGQIVREAQVQHTVGLVHHKELHLVELDLLRALQIEQAPRRGHHEVGILQLGDLQLVRHATHHVGNAQALAVLDQVNGVMRHLLGEFTRGAQHQRAGNSGLEVARLGRVLAAGALRGRFAARGSLGGQAVEFSTRLGVGLGLLVQQGVQHGQQERRRLAAAGLAGDHQVDVAAALGLCAHGQRNRLALHGGGLGVAQVGHGLHQFAGQAQLNEAVGLGAHALGQVGGVGGGNVGNNGIGRRKVAQPLEGVGHGFLTRKRRRRFPAVASFDGYKTSSIKRNLGPQRSAQAGIVCKAPGYGLRWRAGPGV